VTRARDPVLWTATALLLCVAAYGALEALRWHHRPFAGFLVLGNRVVASAGLAHWPATADGEIYGAEVTGVDGAAAPDAAALRDWIEAQAIGTPVRWTFSRGSRAFERTLEIQRFEARDLWLLFGSYLLTGAAFGVVALLVRALRGGDRMGRGVFAFFWLVALYTLTALDLYGPWRMFRLHAAAESFLFAGALHMALVLPQPVRALERRPWLLYAPYLLAAPFALVGQLTLYAPERYVTQHSLAMLLVGLSAAVLIASQVRAHLRPASFEARQRVRVVAFGAIVALGPPVGLTVISPLVGSNASQNAMAFSAFLLPVAVGYAVLRHNLLGVDALIRRSVGYGALTLIAALLYAGAVGLTQRVFSGAFDTRDPGFALAFGLICVGVLLPLRDHVQSLIDRLFFRSAYDYRRLLEHVSGRLAAAADLSTLARELRDGVERALRPDGVALLVQSDAGALRPVGAAPRHLLDLRMPLDRPCVDLPDGGLAVPFRSEGRLVAALMLGAPRAGGIYSGEDRGLVQTLAHQGAVAVRNALVLEQLRELNRSLEEKVEARTRDLSKALDDLRTAQTHLVHREKMASLGQFVAGIAHELNNPLNFIVGNFHYLHAYAHALIATLQDADAAVRSSGNAGLVARLDEIRLAHDVDAAIGDLRGVFEGCSDGIERATGLVRDLRTFSRPDRGAPSEIDLHAALDATLGLLRSALGGCAVERQYGELPRVECLAGQINQVFMNLLANAADAVGGRGRIVVRTAALGSERVSVEVEDDGCGIDPAHIERIFDPFFTTKPVGKGTGLGLAISYGIVERHGGSLSVQSQPGRGACFRVELPVRFAGA
jgi:signal transduction histidine kinase